MLNLEGGVLENSRYNEVLDLKKWEVLSATVSGYIRSALPVGSNAVNRYFGLSYSPATIRNIMSDLEELGYLTHPHTSAGRVPTEKGFRYFVDHSDFKKRAASSEWKAISRVIEPLLSGASVADLKEVLSDIVIQVSRTAGYAVFVMETRTQDEARVVSIEAVPISGRHVLVIVIFETGQLLKKTIAYPEGIRWGEFRKIIGKLNRIGRFRTLSSIREDLLIEMEGLSLAYAILLREFETLGKTPDFKLYGASQFAKIPEFSKVTDLKSVFEVFEEQMSLFAVLKKMVEPRGVSVAIGSENQVPGLDVCTVISIPLTRFGAWFGTIGVVGPVRMEYAQVIPLMTYLSDRLNEWLSGRESKD